MRSTGESEDLGALEAMVAETQPHRTPEPSTALRRKSRQICRLPNKRVQDRYFRSWWCRNFLRKLAASGRVNLHLRWVF